jgi:hypothetical protein
MAKITITDEGAFLPTMGVKGFEVWIDGALTKASRGYLRGFDAHVELAPGRHTLEIRAINRLTGWHRHPAFHVDVPDDAAWRLPLVVSRAWGTWRQPVLERAS